MIRVDEQARVDRVVGEVLAYLVCGGGPVVGVGYHLPPVLAAPRREIAEACQRWRGVNRTKYGPVDPAARTKRFVRAYEDVLGRSGRVVRRETVNGVASFAVRDARLYSGGVVVTVHEDWSEPPTCTCIDKAATNAGFCAHIIGCLLSTEDLRHQLLALFS